MTPHSRAIVIVALVVLAGCSFTLDSGQTPSPAPTTGVEEKTPSSTPTPNETSPFPPGVNETTIVNVSALLSAHTAALNRTGYVANGSGNTTILRSGFLVEVFRNVRVVAVEGSHRYYEIRRTRAGPVNRVSQRYSNGSVEFLRRAEDGDVTFRRRKPQTAAELARVEHLDSFLRGGNFSVVEVREDADPPTVLLRANETDNETALLSGLPSDAKRIRSYNATVLIDSAGRVRRLNATVGFVIGGNNRTHTVTFRLARIGVANVSEPDWIDEMNESDERGNDRSKSVDTIHDPADNGGASIGSGTDLGQRRVSLRRAETSNRPNGYPDPGVTSLAH